VCTCWIARWDADHNRSLVTLARAKPGRGGGSGAFPGTGKAVELSTTKTKVRIRAWARRTWLRLFPSMCVSIEDCVALARAVATKLEAVTSRNLVFLRKPRGDAGPTG